VVVMRHGPHGSVLDVGRKRRTAPPPIRRALAARDRHCQFPGCTARPCDAHHLQPWALGGRTSLNGLILLCRRHHTAVHEGGLAIQRGRDGTVTVVWPDGRRLDSTPPLRTLVEIGLPAWPPMHPAGQRCSSLPYSRYAGSSRLAGRAPRRPSWQPYSDQGPHDLGRCGSAATRSNGVTPRRRRRIDSTAHDAGLDGRPADASRMGNRGLVRAPCVEARS
jgi:hypothetical protein